jgi:hypothetical protein
MYYAIPCLSAWTRFHPMCELAELAASRRSIDLGRYRRLHADGRMLIRDWLDRAAAQDAPEGDFESFIYLWIALNGWAACVTGEDSDPTWKEALMADPSLNEEFDRLVSDSTATAAAARRFAELWPIFRASDLRAGGIEYSSDVYESRAEMTQAYLNSGARFAPRCFVEHDELPLDWGHTLDALYRVRCNLFHGEKARSSENDQLVVGCARDTLLAFAEEARLFR